jgi:hypothetical protein
MSSTNGPTYEPDPKSQGTVPSNDHDPAASVVAKPGSSILPSGGLLMVTDSVIELFGWKPVPTALAMHPGQFPETLTLSVGPAGEGGDGGT